MLLTNPPQGVTGDRRCSSKRELAAGVPLFGNKLLLLQICRNCKNCNDQVNTYLGYGVLNCGITLLINGEIVCSAKTPSICNFPTTLKPE